MTKMAVLATFMLLANVLVSSAGAAAIGSDPSGRYFRYQGEPTPILLLSSDQCYGIVQIQQFPYTTFLDNLEQFGMNFTRVFPGSMPIYDGNIYDASHAPTLFPWAKASDGSGKYDLDRWNEEFFDRLVSFVQYARDRGIVVDIVLFNGFGNWWGHEWRIAPMNPVNNINIRATSPPYLATTRPYDFVTLVNPELVRYQEAYIQEITRRLNGFDNVIYDLADEPDAGVLALPATDQPMFLTDMSAWVRHMLAVLANYESSSKNPHLISQTFATQIPDATRDPGVGWISLEYLAAIRNIGRLYDRNKPQALIETAEFPLRFVRRADPIADSRVEGWEFMVGGGAGAIQFNESYTAATPTGDANTATLLAQKQILKTFLESFEFWEMTRYTDSVRVTPAGNARLAAMAESGKQYAAYVHQSRRWNQAQTAPGYYSYETLAGSYRSVITLAGVPAGSYQVEWIDPATGDTISTIARTHAGGDLLLPTPDYAIDIALRVRGPSVTSFSLVDARYGAEVSGFSNIRDRRLTIDRTRLPERYSIRANVGENVESVIFDYNGAPNYQTESASPYCIRGDASTAGSPCFPWWDGMKRGAHVVLATPYSAKNGAGFVGKTRILELQIR